MSREDASVIEAKNVIKHQIKFLESLKKHISGTDLMLKSNAMWTTWVLHKYMQNQLIEDIEMAQKLNHDNRGEARNAIPLSSESDL